MGPWTVWWFKEGAWQERGGGVFEGGWYLNAHYVMLAQNLAPFACLFSNWWSSSCKFSIIGLISGLKFSLLCKFSFLSYFSLKIVIFSWVVEFLENILAFSLKQDLVYSHKSLAEERLLNPRPRLQGYYKIGSVCPSLCPYILLELVH